MVCQTEIRCVWWCVCLVPVLACLSLWTSVWQLDGCSSQTPADYYTCSQNIRQVRGAQWPCVKTCAADSLLCFLQCKQTYAAQDTVKLSALTVAWLWHLSKSANQIYGAGTFLFSKGGDVQLGSYNFWTVSANCSTFQMMSLKSSWEFHLNPTPEYAALFHS